MNNIWGVWGMMYFGEVQSDYKNWELNGACLEHNLVK